MYVKFNPLRRKKVKLKNSLRFLLCLLIVTCVSLPLVLQADVYIKQKRHTDAFEVMGQAQPAKDEITITWMDKDKARIDQGEESSIIILLDKKIMYQIDHTKMAYTEIPFEDLENIITGGIEKSEITEEEKAEAEKFMKGFAGMMKPEVQITDTGEKKKIKDWKCRKYIAKMKMMMMTSTSEIWATEDIKIDYKLFRTLGNIMMPKQLGLQEMMKEMEKIKGLPVLSTSISSTMGSEVKSTEELVEVKKTKAPSGIYEIPEGYKKEKAKK